MTRLLIAAALAATTAGLVHVFRNRLLESFLPRLIAALRKRFGDAADVRAARLDERWQLVLEGVRIPLPHGFVLEIESALVAGILGLSLPGGFSGLRVLEARGSLSLVGDALPLAALMLPIVYRADPAKMARPVCGNIEIREGTWAHRRDDLGGTPYLSIDLHLTAGADGWGITHGRVLAGGAEVEVEASGADSATVRARFAGVDAALADHLFALAEPAGEWTLPRDLAASGLFERTAAGPMHLHAEVHTARSSVVLDLRLADDGGLSGKVTGKLSIAEVLDHDLLPDGVRPLPNGELMFEAELDGSFAAPGCAGKAFIAALEIAAGSPTVVPTYRFFDVSAPFRLKGQELVLTGATANAASGKLTLSSTVEFGIWPVQHASEIAWDGVRIEQVPTAPGQRALETLLCGAIAGHVRLVGQGGDLDLASAVGEVTLTDPDFRFLRKAESALSQFGLPAPSTHGVGPCTARLAVTGGALQLDEIRGRLAGLSFAGGIAVRFDATIAGRLDVTLEPEYLVQSRTFGAGAGLGPVTVPMDLAGTLSAPDIAIDFAGAIGGLLRGKSVSNVVGAIGNMLSAPAASTPPTTPPSRPQADPETDAMLEHILAGGEDADRLMDRLISTGVTPDQVRTMLADYRRRRGD